MHFLVVYDRSAGTLLEAERAFSDRSEAMLARYEAERQHQGDSNVEAVVLDASSPAALRRTHARYFMSLGELASQTRGDSALEPAAPSRSRQTIRGRFRIGSQE